jgi:hypothetical protein
VVGCDHITFVSGTSVVTDWRVSLRRFVPRGLLLFGGLGALTTIGIRLTERADVRGVVRRALADGAHLDDSLSRAAQERPAERAPFAAAIALSYFARLELGLGSPFRLVELARLDPRLPATWRSRVAYGILSRLSRGDRVMRAAPTALAANWSASHRSAAALQHVLDSLTALEGDTPQLLEAIRIAAVQASARGSIPARTLPLIDASAVQAFDRMRARRDVAHLIAAASRRDGDVLQVLSEWRGARLLLVERPALADAAPSALRVAARVPAILAAVEEALARAATDSAGAPATAALSLTPGAATALNLLISIRTRPPQPQVRLSVIEARTLTAMGRGGIPPRIQRFVQSATNEETLVASVALAGTDSVAAPFAAAAALLASQGMRTLAQEAPFHPGVVAVRPAQVVARLGLAAMEFGDDVPDAWQPFYAREFAEAVEAFRAVFPHAEFSGLRVRIGDRVRDGSLAVHDPRTRTLVLPLGTGFGAIAHELMHDLDWQSARLYANRVGTYATDNASRGARRQPIAAPLARLAEFVPTVGLSAAAEREARRPAELLARGADWYLAAALARHGRSNGALTAVQDGWVRGYASATGPAPFGDHAAALAALFDQMPMLMVRAELAPRSDAERSPDLGAVVRAAWTVRLPERLGQLDAFPMRVGATAACSPVTRLRLAPIAGAARRVASRVLEARVDRAMRRWARDAEATGLTTEAGVLRAALLGAPVDPAVIAAARTRWTADAWRALPCLLD